MKKKKPPSVSPVQKKIQRRPSKSEIRKTDRPATSALAGFGRLRIELDLTLPIGSSTATTSTPCGGDAASWLSVLPGILAHASRIFVGTVPRLVLPALVWIGTALAERYLDNT